MLQNGLATKFTKFMDNQIEGGIALASLSRTATNSTADFTNYGHQGILIFLDVTAVHASGSDIKVKIEGKDPASGKYYTILESASVITVTTNVYRVNPLLTAAANTIAKDNVPTTFRFTLTHANANAITYSVGYSLV